MKRNTQVEQCWILAGTRQGRLWHARRLQPTTGEPTSVGFDADWVLEREEAKGDIVGFYHTHPSGMPLPSKRDDRTMHAWISSLGKPLLCVIEADKRAVAYEYEDDESGARELTSCELFPRGVVVVYEEGIANDG